MADFRLLAVASLLALAACGSDGRASSNAAATSGAAGTVPPAEESVGTAPSMGPYLAIAPADLNFIYQALYSGLSEVQIGQLALQRSTSPSIRSVAEMMVRDHRAANDQLDRLARMRGAPAPVAPDPGRQSVFELLSQRGGGPFDSDYLNQQISEHLAAIALYRDQADRTHDAELQRFAADTLPVLRRHLDGLNAAAAQPLVSMR